MAASPRRRALATSTGVLREFISILDCQDDRRRHFDSLLDEADDLIGNRPAPAWGVLLEGLEPKLTGFECHTVKLKTVRDIAWGEVASRKTSTWKAPTWEAPTWEASARKAAYKAHSTGILRASVIPLASRHNFMVLLRKKLCCKKNALAGDDFDGVRVVVFRSVLRPKLQKPLISRFRLHRDEIKTLQGMVLVRLLVATD